MSSNDHIMDEATNENGTNSNNLLDDSALLGIDEPLKLKTRKKIARIDEERLLHNPRGLPYLIKNQRRLLRIIDKHDKEFYKQEKEKISIQPNYKPSTQLKHEHEYKNLVSILQFYQLWCHGMFPKANFKDCAYLIRSLGHKSSQLRLYRRELIEKQIYKLKVAKGIIDENENGHQISKETLAEDNNALRMEEDGGVLELRPTVVTADNDDDDVEWDFMRVGTTTNGEIQGRTETTEIAKSTADDAWDDLEDDDVDAIFEKSTRAAPKISNNEEYQFEENEEEEEDEELAMELMRQVDP